MRANKGFTLVEILIVVVILGILAAIVIPQFTNASTQAKENSLRADLQTLRSQIELYKIQHVDTLPGSTAGVSFEQALTGYTNQDGTAAAAPGVGVFGPYMQKIPTNGFNNLNTVNIAAINTAGSNGFGWVFDDTTGQILPDDNYDGNGDGTLDHLSL